MIIPNLMVTDIEKSLNFYKDILGMELVVLVSPQKDVSFEGNGAGAAFATLEWKNQNSTSNNKADDDNKETQSGGQIMLQTAQSLADELSIYSPENSPTPSGTIYFRGLDPETIQNKAPQDIVVKGPFQQWYGMNELYLRDPDGYIICVGIPAGNPPQ
ncbi:VOC family protein [Kiloniella majae]|uniref:VOC family protein n=1 Tax=Kiloniella majae TaxID=1938558 RepID=UPI000A277484|nr:VOC family protein [Kiloniella majae]